MNKIGRCLSADAVRETWLSVAGVHFAFILITDLYRCCDSSLCRNPGMHSKSVARVYLYHCFQNEKKEV